MGSGQWGTEGISSQGRGGEKGTGRLGESGGRVGRGQNLEIIHGGKILVFPDLAPFFFLFSFFVLLFSFFSSTP
jgi:hypothetical protein